MKINTKQELYNYLNNFDFLSVMDTKLSSVYFLVEFDNHIEPIYFTQFEDVWFESPCEIYRLPIKDDEVMDFAKEVYYEDSWEDGYEYEKTKIKDGWLYDIDCPQCSPFLPDEVRIIGMFSDSRCIDWILEQRKSN